MTFILRRHIREVLDETGETDIETLADAVYARTPRNEIREAYRQALSDQVRKVLGYHAPHLDRDEVGMGSTSAIGRGHNSTDTQTGHTPSGGGNIRNSRAALLRRNRFRVHVWLGQGVPEKHVLECTRDNLEFAAAESDRNAQSNARRARQYRRLVKIMTDRGVSTVGELIDDDIEEALNDE